MLFYLDEKNNFDTKILLVNHALNKIKGKTCNVVDIIYYLNGTSNTTSTEDPGWNIRLSVTGPLIVV